jgi:hypothetical protein
MRWRSDGMRGSFLPQALLPRAAAEVAVMLKAIHAAQNRDCGPREGSASEHEVAREQLLTRAAELVEVGIEETFAYYAFPKEHWRRILCQLAPGKNSAALSVSPRQANALEAALLEVLQETGPARLVLLGALDDAGISR